MHSCATAPLALARTISSATNLSSILVPANATPRPRPSLARQKKRVSFDAQSPLNISFNTTISESPSHATTSSPSQPLTIEQRRIKDVVDGVDLRAVLAAGIVEWRSQTASLTLESS